MFGSRSNPSVSSSSLDQIIKNATDETLTADNWQYILDVCDHISSNPEEATKQAIKSVSLRLASKDANVILRTLSLLVSIAENCGSRMKQEIATKTFLQESLLKRLGDRKLHKTVKVRIAEVIEQLHKSFKSDPSLKPMSDAYKKLVSEYPQYLHNRPAAPNKPAKKEIRKEDKLKEEEELQRALKVSLQEYEREQSIKKNYLNNKPLPGTTPETNNITPDQPLRSQNTSAPNGENASNDSKTIATVSKVRALYDLISYEPDELSFRKGDMITVIESVYRDWWRGSLPNGKTGIFPLNYVTPVITKSPEELRKEVEAENKVLAIESRKVDKLLALLSSNPEAINEDEITQLYNDIIPLRPTLGKFIDKYNVRKEELLLLNNQLNNEVKLYNELLDKSISMKSNQQANYSVMPPYPTGPTNPLHVFQNNVPQPFGGSEPLQQLQQQPTSSGFGNSIYNQPSSNQYYNVTDTSFDQQQPHHNRTGSQFSNSSQQYQHFSNIDRFPEINNL